MANGYSLTDLEEAWNMVVVLTPMTRLHLYGPDLELLHWCSRASQT